MVSASPYQSYTYSYPHKTAYRLFPEPVSLAQLWSCEDRDALFLYLHVPFCEHRCGFCNLFTQARPEDGLTTRYLRQLQTEADVVRSAVGDVRIQQLAIGGGTPTFLTAAELARLLAICQTFGVRGDAIPVGVEVSPATIDDTKLQLLADFGVDRVSIGIQSFDEAEAHRLGRPQRAADVQSALEAIRRHAVPNLNIDLIYGGEGQSNEQWMRCVREAVRWQPEELYLYPLYVRPLTGLGRQSDREGRLWDAQRLHAYRSAREYLLSCGYRQTSMRMFSRSDARVTTDATSVVPEYHCQTDGMIGLGCGARSYTSGLHYSTEYAVGRQGVRGILADYIRRPANAFAQASHGIRLLPDEQRRRFVILSLMQTDGLLRDEYASAFETDVLEDLPCLQLLADADLASIDAAGVRLTASGLERSDAIGPWLFSPQVHALMQDYELL
ncbi:MAG: STM4012 family radical SAM protein [Planctomycetaceae bacterium]|nr:STM4012 family radical SAM protein [Planctomycetaceae bacterium]